MCKCDCGTTKGVKGSHLKDGSSKSCGCIQKGNKPWNYKGEYRRKLHNVWSNMISRCTDKRKESFQNYGGRGITVCDEWMDSFDAFVEWMNENGYRPGLTLDRIDNDKGYCPSNCRLATMKEQQNNRRNNRKISFNGKEFTISQLSKMTGKSTKVFHNWFDKGFIKEERERRLSKLMQEVQYNGNDEQNA
mgnify:CR=1 FL=1